MGQHRALGHRVKRLRDVRRRSASPSPGCVSSPAWIASTTCRSRSSRCAMYSSSFAVAVLDRPGRGRGRSGRGRASRAARACHVVARGCRPAVRSRRCRTRPRRPRRTGPSPPRGSSTGGWTRGRACAALERRAAELDRLAVGDRPRDERRLADRLEGRDLDRHLLDQRDDAADVVDVAVREQDDLRRVPGCRPRARPARCRRGRVPQDR